MDELYALAVQLGSRLNQKGWMLTIAESCTGGLLSATITEIPGSSNWFERGYVTYSNAAKIELLGVKAETLEKHGAVSEETAREMAQGALKNSRAQIAVSITGIAGPDGGSAPKPIGTVCLAWVVQGHAAHIETCHFSGDRRQIRTQSAAKAMQVLLKIL